MTDLVANISFVVRPGDPRAEPFTFATVLATGEALHVAPFSTKIEDMRPRLGTENAPKLDVDGFAAENVPYEGFASGKEGWEDAYSEKMAEWLQAYLGAKKVVRYNYQLRRNLPSDHPDFDELKRPAVVAHVDGSQKVAFERACKFTGISEEQGRKEHLAIINLWRPLVGPVGDFPLAVCDTRTARLDDLTITTDVYGEGSFARHSPEHRWHYLRDMMPDEMLLLRCFDSTKSPDEGGVTIHTAFEDEARSGGDWPRRESIEIRCAVLY